MRGPGGGVASAMSSSAGPAARLCRLERGPDGYGFHLHSEKGKPGQFIRLVEAGSPAERSGLRAGDRLLEVDGENVERESHQQVVERIRAAAGAVSLLVVDSVADEQLLKRDGPGNEPPVSGGQATPEPAEPAAREPSGGGRRVNGWPGRAAEKFSGKGEPGPSREPPRLRLAAEREGAAAAVSAAPHPGRLVWFRSRFFPFCFALRAVPRQHRAAPRAPSFPFLFLGGFLFDALLSQRVG